MNFQKSCVLMNSFYTSQFNYCPLVWMFHSRTMNIKPIAHERYLRIVYSDKTSSFEKLLEIDLCHCTLEIYRSLQQSFSKKVKIWLLLSSVKFSQNEAFSIICLILLSSLFQTWKALFVVEKVCPIENQKFGI